ncbi:acyltransferase family protein [Knoellia subterranea]|uniref:acyltransferase family protein n=1 Tax=Knoellia subterranea TaxID=184882 RepID=UPI0014706E22|nr:acyltransferase [Knoellia subterranea]
MPDTERSNSRNATLDGLRGLAVFLVVLAHVWIVYPFDRLEDIAPLDGWFRGGNIAVSMLLVLSGFLFTRSLLRAHETSGPSGLLGPLLRRTLRISAQIYLVLLAVLVLAEVDSTDTTSPDTNTRSAVAIGTYTWNWYVRDHALDARPDLGHLWYLNAELHVFLLLTLAIAFWGRRRTLLTIGVVALIAAVTWWRWYVHDTEGWYSASLRTSTRADAALYGVLAGLMWDRVQQWRREAPAAAGASALLIIGTIFSCSMLGIDAYFKGQGIVIAFATAVFVVAASMGGTDGGPVGRLFGSAPLTRLGTVSLTLYVWHLPVYWFMSRHTKDWSNLSRAMATAAVLIVLVSLVHRFVDEPVRRWTSNLMRKEGNSSPTSRPASRTRSSRSS